MIRKGKIFQNVAALNFIRAARPSPSHQSDANKDSSVTTITLPDAQIDSSVAPTRDDPVVSLQLPSSSLVVLSSPSASLPSSASKAVVITGDSRELQALTPSSSAVILASVHDAQIDSGVAPTRDDPVVSLQLPSSSLVVLSSPSASPARPPTSPLQLLAELFDSDSDDEHRDPFAYVDALRLPLPDVE